MPSTLPENSAARLARRLLAIASTEITPHELSQSALLFSPHPDDESLGCAGTIIKKKSAGATVRLVHMTDGSASSNGLIPKDDLKAIRKRESSEAGRVLGVDQTIFLDFEDGKLWDSIACATVRVAEIILTFQPEQIFIPYRYEPMRQAADHLATTKIVRAALRQVGKPVVVWEYPIWAWLHWPWVRLLQPDPPMRTKHIAWNSMQLLCGAIPIWDWRRFVKVSDVLDQKRTAISQHRSQNERLVERPQYMTLADVCRGEFLDCFNQSREYFHVYDYPIRR